MVTGRREFLGKRGGPEQSWIGAAGATGTAELESENIYEQSTLDRYVSEYGQFYGGRSGRHTGGGMSDPFRSVQYPERSEQGTGSCPTRNVPGQHGPGSIPRN